MDICGEIFSEGWRSLEHSDWKKVESRTWLLLKGIWRAINYKAMHQELANGIGLDTSCKGMKG